MDSPIFSGSTYNPYCIPMCLFSLSCIMQSPDGDREVMVVLRNACDACHRMKRKCDGLQPCHRCRRRSRPCGYSYKQKSGPPKGSKRKLIAADEDLLENRQGRPKLLPLAMWPKDADEEGITSGTANRMNRLLAASSQAPQQPPQPPRLPGISIPPEGSASNGAGAAAAAAAVAAASAVNNAGPSPRPEALQSTASGSPEQSNAAAAAAAVAAAVAAATANAAANAKAAAAAAITAKNNADAVKEKRNFEERHAVNRMTLPPEAAQLSLEARAGAFKRAQEAAAAGMAKAKAAGERPTDDNGEILGNSTGVPATVTAAQSAAQNQGAVGRLVSTPPPTAAPALSLQLTPGALGMQTGSSMSAASHDTVAPSVAIHPLVFASQPASAISAAAQHSASSPASGAVSATAVTTAASAASPQPTTVSPSNAGQPAAAAYPGVGAPSMPSMGMSMAYHPQYGIYQPYPQSLYAAYLAQYQIQQGLSPYDGVPLYQGMNPYVNAAAYGQGAAAAALETATETMDVDVSQGQQGLPGVAGNGPPMSVTAAAAAAIAAAAQDAAARGGEKRQPKESEEAKQVRRSVMCCPILGPAISYWRM